MLPSFNARLTSIDTTARVADGLDPKPRSRVIWEGNTDAYVMHRRVRSYNQTASGSQTSRETFVYVPVELTRRVAVDVGYTLTLDYNGGSVSFVAQEVTDGTLLDALGATCIRVERA